MAYFCGFLSLFVASTTPCWYTWFLQRVGTVWLWSKCLQDVPASPDGESHSSVGWITGGSSGNHSTWPNIEVLVTPDFGVWIHDTFSIIFLTHTTCTLLLLINNKKGRFLKAINKIICVNSFSSSVAVGHCFWSQGIERTLVQRLCLFHSYKEWN